MASGTIINVWTDATRAYAAVSVNEGGQIGRVEYIGSVPKDAAFVAMTTAEKKAALVAAVKAVRDVQRDAPVDLAGISGAVTL